jgi:predicted kinase
MKKAVFCDLDGSLCDVSARRFHVSENNDWKSFFEGIPNDTIFPHTESVVRAMHAAGYEIVICTARPDENGYREMTVEWLGRHNIPYSTIYMRKGGDYRKDSIIKIELLEQMYTDGYDVQFALDDRNQVTNALREWGLPVMQVNPGDFDNEPKLNKKLAGQIILEILVGPSGAGKSTLIAENIRKGIWKQSDIMSSDAIRDDLYGGHEEGQGHTPEELARTWRYIHKLIAARVSEAVHTVVDATNIRTADRKKIADLAPKNTIVRYVVVDRPYNDKLATKGWRPEKLVEKHHRTFKSNLPEILRGDSLHNVIVDKTNLKGDYKV